MPIRPDKRWLYPIDWPQLSAVIRFERAKGRCEHCARPHGQLVCHAGDGSWWDEAASVWRDGRGRAQRRRIPPDGDRADVRKTRVRLSTTHIDHDLANNAARNLRALCQRCQMLHNRDRNRRQRWHTLHRRKALGDLFLGRYAAG